MAIDRLLRSRKCVEALSFLLAVVVGIVFIVIMLSFISKLGEKQEEDSYNSRCRNSVLAYAKLNALPFGEAIADEGEILCPTRFVEIADGRPSQMRRDVANLMFNCWHNYGEGRLNLFDPGSNMYCAICDVFEFEDKSTKLDHFVSFLMSERVPVDVGDGYRPTYFEYLSDKTTDADTVSSSKKSDMNYLDGSKRYAVLFTHNKENVWYDVVNTFAGSWENAGMTAGAGVLITLLGDPIALFVASTAVAAIPFAAVASSALTGSGEWHASVVLIEYSAEGINEIGCEQMPVSMLDKQFR
jgi:hypothetical protein